MTGLLSAFRRLAFDRRGVTVIEFAIIAPVVLVVTMGMTEIGYNAYMRAMVQGAVNAAARDSTLEGADPATIDAAVLAEIRNISTTVEIESTRTSYASFSDVGSPEDFNDTDGDGIRDATECFEDENENGSWDTDRGQEGQGGADDIVSYRVVATYPLLFPIDGLAELFPPYTGTAKKWPSELSVTGVTALRNQPYGTQASREVACTL